jgi:putative inorganic carbon (HCO3(-)) transporter
LVKKQFIASPASFTRLDRRFLEASEPINFFLLLAAAVILAGIGLFLIFIIKKWAERPMKIAGIIFLPALFIGGVLFILFMGERWADNPDNIIWQASEVMRGNFGDRFGSGRGWIWKNAADVLFDRPILGSGPDTFYYALGDARQLEAHAIFNLTYDKAHNIFLQIAVCMGLPAALAYITFVFGLLVSSVKKAFERPLLLAFGAAALSYMIQSFFCVEVPITTPLVWVSFGVVAREIWLDKIGVAFEEI